MPSTGRLALAAACGVAAAGPVFGGLNLVAYALGSPDSPRYFVGLVAVVALLLAGGLLYIAGRLLATVGVRPPVALPALSALAVLPLLVASVPLQYDQDPPLALLALASAGVVVSGVSLAARDPRSSVVLGLGSLAVFYVVCLLLDLESVLPDLSPGDTGPAPPAVSPRPAPPPPSS